MRITLAVALTALLIGIPAAAGAGKGGSKEKPIQYLYGKPKPVPPSQETELTATCPKGTFAVSGGFAQFDSATEEGLSDPAVSVVFEGVVDAADKPGKLFDARTFSVILRNLGKNADVQANARAVCLPASKTKLVTGVEK